MNILVTGGSGLLGTAVVQELRAFDFTVTSVDRVHPQERIEPFKLIDLTDLGQVYGVAAGMDAIVHLAAIPRPQYDAPEVVFRTNVMATFNVLEAAINLGVPRVVYASSVSVLGYPFFTQPIHPAYVPIDEDHPRAPQDPYGLSKHLGEELAEGYVRRSGGKLSVISLRLPWIHTPRTFAAQLSPLWSAPEGGASNLWSYVDSRDAAQAFRLAITADVTDHEAFFISARDSFMPTDSTELVRQNYPQTEIRDSLVDCDSLLDCQKAERLLGFQAKYSWRSYEGLPDF